APENDAPGRFVDGPVGPLFVRAAGERGPAVLLVHGLGGASAHWRAQLAPLGERARVAAPDPRGHGRSRPSGAHDHSLAAHVADADAMGLERFVLAGHSFGAHVAIELAARHPERVLALVLVDPSGDSSAETPAAIAAAVAAVRSETHDTFAAHYHEFLHGG